MSENWTRWPRLTVKSATVVRFSPWTGNGGVKDGEIGSGDGADAIAQMGDPGDGAAEVEAQSQIHAHRDLAADALDDANDVWSVYRARA